MRTRSFPAGSRGAHRCRQRHRYQLEPARPAGSGRRQSATKIQPRILMPGEDHFLRHAACRSPHRFPSDCRICSATPFTSMNCPAGTATTRPVTAGSYSSQHRPGTAAAGKGFAPGGFWPLCGCGFSAHRSGGGWTTFSSCSDYSCSAPGWARSFGRSRPLRWRIPSRWSLSIYGVIRLPSSVTEPLIAASIVFIAVENLFTSEPQAVAALRRALWLEWAHPRPGVCQRLCASGPAAQQLSPRPRRLQRRR